MPVYTKNPEIFAYADVKQAFYISGSDLEHCLPQQDPKAHTPKCSASFPSGQHFATPAAEYAVMMVVATKQLVAYSWAICFYM